MQKKVDSTNLFTSFYKQERTCITITFSIARIAICFVEEKQKIVHLVKFLDLSGGFELC